MKNEMKRGRSQVIWRYMPGATFRYNENGGWCSTTIVTPRDPAPLTGVLAEAVGEALSRWNAIGPAGYPDPNFSPNKNKYEAGEPYQVMYTVWPTIFSCRSCGRIHYYNDLQKLLQVNDRLGCMSCKGRDQLRQVPFAFVCECGRIDSISMQKHEPGHHITLVNKGSFQESYWWCKTCGIRLGKDARSGLGYRRCSCGKLMRGTLVEDSRTYYSQTIDLVEVEPAILDRWKDHPRFSDMLLGAILQISAYKPDHLGSLAKWKPSDVELTPELLAMQKMLIQRGLSKDEADEMVKEGARQAGADPWIAYDQDLAPFRSITSFSPWKDSRRTKEYIFVRDDPGSVTLSIEDIISEARVLGDMASVQRLENEREIAAQLGLVDLRVVQALPILLSGIGYTRYYASPSEVTDTEGEKKNNQPVVLRPYASSNEKIPIYVARNTTEALLYSLDPWRLAAFLEVNLGLSPSDELMVSTSGVRAWLLSKLGKLVQSGESHLVLRAYEQAMGIEVDEVSALVFGVLHTISHVLKATAHRYVGIDDDALAEYLFPAHTSGLLYVSSHVSFTLGGLDAVFRTNLLPWLGSARDYAGQCSFDPVCAHSGGACLACLYPKFGCGYFNRTLSRAFLFGGNVPGRQQSLEGFWTPIINDATQNLQRRFRSL